MMSSVLTIGYSHAELYQTGTASYKRKLIK